MLRTATLPCSAYLPATLTSSLRRSSDNGGIGMRISWPSEAGFSPRSDSMIAFSTALARPRSQTLTERQRGSGTLMVPTWEIGVIEP